MTASEREPEIVESARLTSSSVTSSLSSFGPFFGSSGPVLASFCSGPSPLRLAWRVPLAGGTLHERQNRLNRNLLQKIFAKDVFFDPRRWSYG